MWCSCCAEVPAFVPRGRAYGPSPWAWRWGSPFWEPTKAERREWLEAYKKRLQEQLADVDDDLGKL